VSGSCPAAVNSQDSSNTPHEIVESVIVWLPLTCIGRHADRPVLYGLRTLPAHTATSSIRRWTVARFFLDYAVLLTPTTTQQAIAIGALDPMTENGDAYEDTINRIDGKKDDNMWVTGTGYLNGIFVEDYLSIPSNNCEVNIRWGEFYRLEGGRITEVFFLLDLVDLIQQAGFQVLPPSRVTDGVYPPPRANDGILLEAQTSIQVNVSDPALFECTCGCVQSIQLGQAFDFGQTLAID